MKKLLPILLSALMLTGCTGAVNSTNNTYRQISMDEAVAMMERESGYIILDVRTPEEFAEKHIPNAINIPNTVFTRMETAVKNTVFKIDLLYSASPKSLI